MGVIDKVPGYGEDGLYSFSSRPVTPGVKTGNLLVKFQAVSRSHQTQSHHYIRVNSKDRLSHVRRTINLQFKEYFERGFIFLSKTREILRSDERKTTVFDILPKIPVDKPTENFRYPDVEYKRVSHTYDDRRYIVMCACVVFLYERSKVSHWPSHELNQQLSENLLEGFSFIPTDIMSWKPKLIELQATLLHINAACGNVKDLEDAIKKLPYTPNVYDICDERNATPLHYAAENGKLDACEILINGIGRDQIFVKDMHGRSPLHCALYRRRKDVIIYLLQLNSEVRDVDNKGNSCTDLLLRQHDIDISYIASNLEIRSLDKHLQFHLSYIMLYLKREKHCARLLQMLPDFETFDFSLIQRDCSLLHLSSKLNSKLTEILIQKKFSKLERDFEGNLPFHIACQYGHIQQIKLLFDDQISEKDLNKGIKVALRNQKFESCLVIDKIKTSSVLYETTVCMVMESLNKLFDVLRKNPKKQKFVETVASKLLPLLKEQECAAEQYVFEAAFYGLHKTLCLLQSLGIKFNLSDEMNRTPLHEACQRNHKECVQLLLKGDAKPNTTDWRGGTPLHYACEAGHDAIVKILIQSNQEIGLGAQDGSGKTPLMAAISRNHPRVVRLLLQSCIGKCNLKAVDNIGQTVLHYLPMVDDDLEDLLMQSYKLETVAENKNKESVPLEMENLHGKCIVWNETVEFTFNNQFVCNTQSRNEKEKNDPFYYEDIELPWNEHRANKTMHQQLCSSPYRKYKICQTCNNVMNTKYRHLCTRYKICQTCNHRINTNDGHRCANGKYVSEKNENEEVFKEYRAFEFHQQPDFYFNCPFQNAIKVGKLTTFKKLALHFPSLLKKDTSKKNILDFALQHHSLKVMKAVKDVVEPNADFLHHIIMIADKRKLLATQNVIETFLHSGIQVDYIPEPINFSHTCKKEIYEKCNCDLKQFTLLEAAVITKHFPIFHAVLEKAKDNKLGIALHLAVYFGLSTFVDILLKKMQKREISREIQAIENAYIIDIACRSPHITDSVFDVLLRYQPDFLDSRSIFSCDDLFEFRPGINKRMYLHKIKEQTPLAKLLSNQPFQENSKHRRRQSIIDKAGCLIIRAGLHLGLFETKKERDSSSTRIHGICEALLPALESGYFESAISMIQKEGHVLWHCALTKHECDVQKRFRNSFYTVNKNYQNLPVEYIKYILMYSCQKHIPEVILQKLIQSGMEIEGIDTTDVSVREFEINDRLFAIAECKTIIEKIARCVIEYVTRIIYSDFEHLFGWEWIKKIKKIDLLRLIRCVPGSINCFSNFNCNALSSLIVKRADHSLLRDCTVMLNRSGQPDCITFPSGTTLLHLACSTTNLEFVKLILKAPLPVNINAKTRNDLRPIDIAVIYGSWDIYKFLVDNGATFTANTIIACCSDDRYECINSWTKRIRTLCSCEKPSSKTKKRILIDLYERKKIDWNNFSEERGSPLYNAIDNHFDDIVIYLADTDPSLLVSALDYNVNVIERMQLCSELTLGHVFNIMSSQISRFKMKTLGQLLLQTTISKRKNLTENLIRAFHRVIERKQWEMVLQEKENHGRNTFHFIAIYGWEKIARQLVQLVPHVESKSNVPLNETDLAGASPLWYALAFKRWKLAKLYILAGANAFLQRAVPGCFMKKPKSPDINDVLFKECEQFNVLTSARGIKLSTRRKIQSFKDVDSCTTGEIITSSKNVSETKCQQKLMPPSIDRDKKRVEYLLKKAYMSQMNGYSLIHFASRTGDSKLLEEILSISDEKHKYGEILSQAGHRLAIIGNQTAICDVYQKYGVNHANDDVFHSIVWQALRNEDIQSNVYRFLFFMLGFVYDNSIKSSETSLQRYKCAPTYRGFNYKYEKQRFAEYLENLCKALSAQGEDQNLIAQLKSILQYIYRRVNTHSMERKNFETLEIYSQSLDPSSMENNMTTFLKSIDGKCKTDEKDILLLLSMNQTWIIRSLLAVSKTNKFVAKLLSRQLLWNLNMLDCIIIALPEDHGRTEKVSFFQQDMCESIEILVNLLNLYPQELTIRLASKKCLWIFLMHVATRVIPKERELKVSWQISLTQAVRCGHIAFVKSIVDNISIPKLPEVVQASFAALLCCGAFYGQTEIVKYLFRKSVSIKFDKENPMFADLLGDIYVKHNDVLEYAIRSKQPETVDAVIKFCKFDKEFMKNTKPADYFELAANQGIWQIMKNFLDLFGNNELPSKSSWEKFFMKAAQRGQEEFCAKLLAESKTIDVLNVDKSNKNVLHYCGMYNMQNVTQLVLEKSSTGVDLSDSDGMRPMDYAVNLGNISVLDLLMKAKFLHLKQTVESVEANGWFRFHMNKVNSEEAEMNEVSIRPALPKARTLDLSNLYKRGEDDAAATVIFCSKHIPILLLENPSQYGFILHDAIKYGCEKSFHAIMAYFEGDGEEIRRVLKLEFKGLTSLAAAVCYSQLAIAEYIFKYDDGTTWVMEKSAKNILHLAVYTQDPKMIELVGSKTYGKLCGMKDSCGLTPEVYMCSLGLQNHYACLKTDALLDPWIESHVEHVDSDPDVTCLNCLLNGCIGWSKIYNSTLQTNQLQQIRSSKNALPPNILTEWFWKLGKFRKENPIITSILISSGFDSTYLTLLKLVSRKEGIEKMITVEGIEETLDEFEKSPNILENILGMSVVSNSEVIFVALLDHASNLNRQMKKSYGISLFEAVIGLSRLQLLERLNTKIMFEEDDFATFRELHSVLPQKQLWVSGLDQLGGNYWPYFDGTVEGHTPQILKSDLWMIQSGTIPESIRKDIEAKSVTENIILSDFTELKYVVDFESFRKNPHFAELTDMSINCFLVSSVVLSHIEEIKNSQDAKFSTAKSVKVVCLTSGTTDHPKVTIDNTGALLNQIRVSIDKGTTFVRQDRSFCQRPKEIRLKEDLQERVIPYFENFIEREFGLQIKVKVDWNAIELRKRTYNTEVILKSLNGELYGNMLGGLEDVLNECRDLKDDIESMFDKETTMCAISDFKNITEIVVSFDDKISSQQVSYKNGHVLGETIWKFTVMQSRLLYNRSQFLLWQHLTLYRAICASSCSSVYCISRIDGLRKREQETKKNSAPSITFEVDSQSFGINDTSTLRTLLCQNVSRELVAIAYDCESMLRLKAASKKIILKSTISLQHTGVTFQEDVATVHICCNETDSKEWVVERSNTLNKLADVEDKQLMLEWAEESNEQLNEIAVKVQKNVTEKTGMVINFQFDEKRILLPCFSKFRRELNHPLELLRRSLTTCYKLYGDVYIKILEDTLLSQKNPTINQNPLENCASGFWSNIKKEKLKTGMIVLLKHLAKQYMVSGFELPCQNKFPVLEKAQFKYVSEPKEVKNYSILWKHEIVTESNQSELRPDLVSMNGKMYSFSDETLFKKQVQCLSLRIVISQDTALALDYGYHDILYKKVLDQSGTAMTESSTLGDTFLMHYQAKKEIQTLLNIDNVEINWQSFVQQDDTSLKQNFANCLHALVDSFHEVFPSIPECIVTQRIVMEMYTLFSRISSIRITMTDDPNPENADDIERQLQDGEKNPSLVIQIRQRGILEILFIRQRKISKFPDLLYRAGVELAEMNIKSLLGIKNRKSYSNNNQGETKKYIPMTIIRPSYDKVMIHLSSIRLSLESVTACIKSFKTIVPGEVEEFYFVTSVKKTGFVIKKKALLYSISKKEVDPGELADQLLEEFQFQSLKNTLLILELSVNEPVTFDKGGQAMEVALDVNDYNMGTKNDDRTNITNPEGYRVTLQGEEESLKVINVERREERLVLTLQTKDKEQLNNKHYIVVHHKYIRPENSKTLLFGGTSMRVLKPRYSSEVCEEIRLKRTDKLKILLEHGKMNAGNGYQPVRNRNEAIYEQDFLTMKVKFTFYYQKKHFPSSDPTTPFTLNKVSSRPVSQLYSLDITDSARYFRLRAQCLCCKRSLDVITPFGRIRAGQDLCVNYPEP